MYVTIKKGFSDLLEFLVNDVYHYVSCEMINLAVQYKRLNIIQFLFNNYKTNFRDTDCFDDIFIKAVETNDPSVLRSVLKNIKSKNIYYNREMTYGRFVNFYKYPKDFILKAIELGNIEILSLLREYYFEEFDNRRDLFNKILEKGDINILKAIYSEGTRDPSNNLFSIEISRSLHADNAEFFKYLIHLISEEDLRNEYTYLGIDKKMDAIKKYDKTWYGGEKNSMTKVELYYVAYYLFHVLHSNNKNILKYFLTFEPVTDYLYNSGEWKRVTEILSQ